MRTIAYLGPEKTNTHFAARKKFGRRCRYLHAPTVEDVFRLVERGEADLGVVPVENSLEGSVTHTLDRFVNSHRSPVRICGEVEMPIQHSLIFRPGIKLREIRTVASHPQALAQCRPWLQRRLPKLQLLETSSTAEAVNRLSGKESSRQAAIGRKELAQGRGLKAISIPLGRRNKTRFLVISLTNPGRSRRNKTSLMFALKDAPGALHDALMPFKKNRINLTKIESRPSKQKAWEYVFFIDCEGHETDAVMRRALQELNRRTNDCRVLGSYPAGSRE